MKKKVFIISHSHWDREWYMAYEQHHMRLINLVDDLLELFKTDPNFNSFHLDGQTIILDDYLQVRPEKKEAVQKAITAGKLRIGPFYILQDDFLTSSESNVRNMLIGMAESKKWGTPVKLGYFPDTFGNMGQTPQMMKQANLDAAAFGRGVKPIGFDNEVLKDDNFTSQYSEMHWEGPDGTKILGLIFANWYSNVNEIPVEKEAALAFWHTELAGAEKYASTNNLLMMNGVDHQPVQKNISQAIALANELFPDYEFIHSNFDDYIAAVEHDLPQNVGTIKGELTSQETDGWYTLANTASARVYLKQWNTKVSRQLENITEPLASMAYELTGKYPHDQLDYAWKTLMQNHPHDSICGCSVDSVHREMMPRFEKANEVGKYLADDALAQLVNGIDTSKFAEGSRPFVVFNTTGVKKSDNVSVDVELERILFSTEYPSDGYETLAGRVGKTYHVVDQQGTPVLATVSEEKIRFDYELPKERFRIPYMEKYVTVTVAVKDLAAFSWKTFGLVEGIVGLDTTDLVNEDGNVLENAHIKVTVKDDGTLSLLNKKTHKQLNDLLVFEDCGDIANEYIFKQPENDRAILSVGAKHWVEVVENSATLGKIRLHQILNLPVSADELLDLEQRKIVDFRKRHAGRSKTTVPVELTTEISINPDSTRVNFVTSFDNEIKDHRLRVLFKTTVKSDTHEADSIFETVVRPNKVSKHWENPTNPQHQHSFANLHQADFGLTVSNFGLNEYEIVDDTIALTLIRCVGELGDWGYFPTPEAQCQGARSFAYGIELHGEAEERYATYQRAHGAQVPLTASQTTRHSGKLTSSAHFVEVTGEKFAVTALKRHHGDNELVLRGYNLSADPVEIDLEKEGKQPRERLNLLEEKAGAFSQQLQPYEIVTVAFKK